MYKPQTPFSVALRLLIPSVTKKVGVEAKSYPDANSGLLFYGSFRTFGGSDEVLRNYLLPVLLELAEKPLPRGAAWNVNFPSCSLEEYRGILYDRSLAQTAFFHDFYYRQERADGGHDVLLRAEELTQAEEGTDIRALLDGYISVGIIRNRAM